MKKLLLIAAISLSAVAAKSQTVVFSDDFEGGTGNWLLSGTWGLTTAQSHSPSSSLTESPSGNYADNATTYAIMASGVNLSDALAAEVSFWAIYSIETGFDYMYVDVSTNGGTSWVNIATFNGEGNLSPWIQYTYSLGGFVGSADVRVRFRFVTDVGYNVDGMYIDDFQITTSNVDNADPLIVHTPPELELGTLGAFNVEAEILDVSGVASSQVTYWVDGGSAQTVSGVNTYGDNYLFVIPAQAPGAWVEYAITATDGATPSNSSTTETFHYIAGNHVYYDNGVVDFVNSFGPAAASGALGSAVRITLNGSTDVVAALIRNYTDNNRPNSPMQVHIWDDLGGQPGSDIITPFTVVPEATLTNPQPMTRVDLRPYAVDLSNISGDIWVGFMTNSGETWVVQSTPAVGNRSFAYASGTWQAVTDDYHFRVVTSAVSGAPTAAFSVNGASEPTMAFLDASTGGPSSWTWNFGDGSGTATQQNPIYQYDQNGNFNVCLTASNAIGSSTACQLVTIDAYPDADFTYDASSAPTVSFTGTATNSPTAWDWDFDDAGAGSTVQSPAHTFTGPGAYNVCLTATNSVGEGQPTCKTLVIWPVGIDELGKGELQVYPNPTSDLVWINTEGNVNVTAIAVDGTIIPLELEMTGAAARVSVSDLPQGVYLLRVNDAEGVVGSARVVKL